MRKTDTAGNPESERRRALRESMRLTRDAMPEDVRRAASEAIARRVRSFEPFLRARRVMAFYSIGSEVDTLPLLADILSCGKLLYLPVCLPGRRMAAVRARDLSALRVSGFGVPEPVGEPEDPALMDLILVPGLAFAGDGHRIGYGAGYYDGFLPGLPAVTLGLAFEAQRVRAIPPREGDVALAYLATEIGLYAFDQRGDAQ